MATGLVQAMQDFGRLLLHAIERETQADQGVVVRPDGTIVVGHRIVATFRRADRPNTPSRKALFTHQRRSYGLGPLLARNLTKKSVPRVGSTHAALLLLPIQSKRIGAKIIAPKCFFELRSQRFCF